MSKYKHSAPKKKKGARSALTGACIVLVLAAALCLSFIGCSQSGGKITATVSILGNNLTDLTEESLREAVGRIADQNPLTDAITLSFLDDTYTLTLDQIGARYDADAITEAAYKAGQETLFARLFGEDKTVEIPLSITWDESRLQSVLSDAAAKLSRSATVFSYEINDDATVTVTKGGDAVTVTDADIAALLEPKLKTMDFSNITIDAQSGHAEIDFDALKQEIDRPMRNPRLDLENDPSGKTVLAGERGVTMDIDTAKASYAASGDADTFTFAVAFTQPTMSVETFKSNLFTHTLSSITSNFNASLAGRTTNVKLACDFCDGIILNPGDEFSYNKAVGPRTYERGFKDATVYVAGTTEEGVGGGICQVSSTIYSAALHADLKITERYNHSYMITYVPLGEDATVVYGSKDFRFVNDTDYPIKLSVTYGKSSMTVKIIGTNLTGKKVEISTKTLSKTPFEVVYKTDTSLPVDTQKVKNNGYTGYTTESYRLVYENGKLVSNTFENKSVYKKLDKLILENPSTPEKSGSYTPPSTPSSGQGNTTVPSTPNPEPATPPTDPVTPDPGTTPEPDDPLPVTP